MPSAIERTATLLPVVGISWFWIGLGGLLVLSLLSVFYLWWLRQQEGFLLHQRETELRFEAAQSRAAEDLKEREDLFRTITSAAADAIIMLDDHGLVSFWNEAAERIFGYGAEEIIGRDFHQILTPARFREKFHTAFPAFQKTGDGPPGGRMVELSAMRKDGSEFPIELSLAGVKIRGGWHSVGIVRDIAARQQVQEELLRNQQKLLEANQLLEQRVAERTADLQQQLEFIQTLLDAIPNPVFFKDFSGHYLGCNKAFEQFRGVARENICGKDVFARLPNDLAAEIHALDLEAMRSGRTHQMESLVQAADGSQRHVIYHKARFTDNRGEAVGLIGVIQDITPLREAERTIRRHNEELEEKIAERTLSLEIANAELDAINHELEERRREAENALATLHRSEVQLRALFDQAAVGVAQVDSHSGRFLKVNQRHAGIFGYTPQEMRAFTFEDLLHPDDLPSFQLHMEAFISGEIREYSLEKRCLHKEGKVIWAALTVSPMWLPGEAAKTHIAVVHEITERVRAEEKLLKLSRAVENSPATVVITDRRGIIEYVNPKFTETSGFLPEEAIGQSPRILKAGELPAEFYRDLWTTICSGNEWRGVFCNRKKTGEIHWEQASISPIRDERGEITHFVAVKEDITEAKRIAEELQKAKEAADAASRFKSEFLANMSHEIRTPLNAIIGFSALALKGDLPGPQRNYLEKIGNAGDSLLNIINDILDFSKVEAGKLGMEKIAFDLGPVVSNAIAVVQQKADEKGLRLLHCVAPDVPLRLMGDPHRLGQIMANLLSNAVKFTSAGEIEFSARLLRHGGASVQIEFSVRDTGIGLASEQIKNLFKPFTQADGSISRKFGGTGLGLAICRQLVEMMGGTIWCENAPGPGSIFHFTAEFGLADEATADAGVDAGPQALCGETPDLAGTRILLVEDNEINQQLAIELLKETGATITVANHGGEAVELLVGRRASFDLVLMDIQMPVMDGYEATRRIRADGRCAALPIIAMTAHVLAEQQKRILEAGMDNCIGKPIAAQNLLQTIARYVGRSTVLPPATVTAEPVVDPLDLLQISGIDTQGALCRMDGDMDLYLWVLQAFIDTHSDSADAIGKALDAGDRATAERLLHTVKGNAGSVGAQELQDSAQFLESALRRDATPEEMQNLLARFGKILERLLHNLAQAMPPDQGDKSADAVGYGKPLRIRRE
ncbi:MAG: PAS domain S-box protein [Desulfuromonadales bacterium]